MNNTFKWLGAAFRRLIYKLFARHFVAGETFDEALPHILRLRAQGLHVTVDILGEAVQTETEAEANAQAYVALINGLAQNGIPVNISVKLTALGLLKEDANGLSEKCSVRLNEVLSAAEQHEEAFIRVDMEDSPFTATTLNIVSSAHARKPELIGPVLQVGLNRTEIDVLTTAQRGMRIRLCKGAYREPEDIAASDSDEVRNRYIRASEYLLSTSATYPAFATHDKELIEHIKELAATYSTPNDSFEFQMLYGVNTKLQKQLVSEGYRVRVYVPYGRDWWKYFHRRLKEGKARNILWMLAQNILKKK